MPVGEEIPLALLLALVRQELAVGLAGAGGLTVDKQELVVKPAGVGDLTIDEQELVVGQPGLAV
jgi:hypothetical protein